MRMVICAVIQCSNRSVRNSDVSYFSFPRVIKNKGRKFHELSIKRRKEWLLRVNRSGLNGENLKYKKVCSMHFINGNPSSLLDETNPDWAPSLKLGHDKYRTNANQANKRYLREADSGERPSAENLEPTIASVNSVDEVCQLHFAESDFEREASTYDPKTGKTFCYNLSNNVKFRKDGLSSQFPNSPVYMPDPNNRHIRLENDKLQSSAAKSLENVTVNQNQAADAVTFLVPLHIFKQLQLSASDYFHWGEKEVTALIALYQSETCLYDKKHEQYYNLHERNKAYERIKNVLVNMNFICTIPQIKNFLNMLFIKYSTEKAYKDKCIQTGQFTEDTYAPIMWCFGLLQFLDDYIETQIEIKTDAIEKEHQHEIQSLNSDVDHLNIEVEPEKVSNIEENVQLKIDSTFSMNSDFNDNLKNGKETSVCDDNCVDSGDIIKVNDSEIEANLKNSASNKLNSIKIFSQDSEEKDDIFGEYIASEMKTLKVDPLLYMQTKQAILDVLNSANYKLLKHE